MTFGTATLVTPKPPKRLGTTYDCGEHGDLTVSEIARRTGLSLSAVKGRVRSGYRGERLLAPAMQACPKRINSGAFRPSSATALRLALVFGKRVPTIAEIRRVRPMSASAAKRWRRVYREVVEAA